MAPPTRLTSITWKVTDHPRARIPGNWQLTIDLDGVSKAYLRTWRKNWMGIHRTGQRMDQTALEALSADYHLQATQETPLDVQHKFCYSATYCNDALEPACLTLLQLGIKARLHLVVDQDQTASFAISTNRPTVHVLREFFPGLQAIPRRRFQRIEQGQHHEPRRLRRFTLPHLPGVDSMQSSPLPMPVIEPIDDSSLVLGDVLSPLTHASVGHAQIPLKRLTRGTLVAGTTGSGKTNTVLHLIHQVRDHAWVLALDVKREYRTLHRVGAKVYGFTGRNLLTHNLLKPVGSPAQYAKEFASILSEVIHRHSPAVGSKDVVTEELDCLYRERGIYEGGEDYPHIGNLLSALQQRQRDSPAREAGWIGSALRVLRSLMVGSTRDAFCVRDGLALERFMNGVTVVELDGIGDPAATSLLASVLLQKIRNHHMNEPPQDNLQGLVVVEEAQHLLAQGNEATSVLATTCREIRSTGIGLVYVTQMPSEFSKHALANVNTLITHRLLHPPDRSLVARMMDLEPDYRRVFGGLAVGECVLHMGRVFLVQLPQVNRPLVRDDELPATRVERQAIATDHARRRGVQNRVVNLSLGEWRVFESIAVGQSIYPSALKDDLRLSHREVSRVLGVLIRKGLVGYRRGKKGGRGKPRNIHFLRPNGEEAYRARHGRYPDRQTMRSPKHAEVVAQVIDVLGVERLPHRRFDVLYEDGRQWAIEVETGSNHNRQIMENLDKSLEFQGEARFVAVNERTRNRIIQLAARHCFDTRRPVMIRVALVDELPEWVFYSFNHE